MNTTPVEYPGCCPKCGFSGEQHRKGGAAEFCEGKTARDLSPAEALIAALRRQRKAALRECGRLGDKLHTARLEIENQRHRIKELEEKVRDAGFMNS
jgi:hypothetical protein